MNEVSIQASAGEEHTRQGEGKYPEMGMYLADLQSREETDPSGGVRVRGEQCR